MLRTRIEPHFVVKTRGVGDGDCFLTWDFQYRASRFSSAAPQVIRGASHLAFDGAGRVRAQRDYWDAAEEVYEKRPVLGCLMRWLKTAAQP